MCKNLLNFLKIIKTLLKNFKNCIFYYYFKKKFSLPSQKIFYDFHKYFNILRS